jgi:hypothetical protein
MSLDVRWTPDPNYPQSGEKEYTESISLVEA